MSDTRRAQEELGAYYDASLPPELYADPHINSLTPSTVSAAAGPTTITVAGSKFQTGAAIEVNQVAQPTTFVSETSLTTSYDPTTAGTVMFTVRNPNGEESNSVAFVVGAIAADEEPEPEPTEEPCEPEAEPEAPAPTAKRSNGKSR